MSSSLHAHQHHWIYPVTATVSFVGGVYYWVEAEILAENDNEEAALVSAMKSLALFSYPVAYFGNFIFNDGHDTLSENNNHKH